MNRSDYRYVWALKSGEETHKNSKIKVFCSKWLMSNDKLVKYVGEYTKTVS
jgi:hypothetical protein